MRLRSGSMYEAAARARAPPASASALEQQRQQHHQAQLLPHEVLVRIFSFLPRPVLAVTPGRVCRAGAAIKAEALAASAPPACDEDVELPPLPEWYMREAYEGATPPARNRMKLAAIRYGQIDLVADLLAVHGQAFGDTAFQTAARFGQLDMLRLLLEHSREVRGGWVCCAAARNGDLAMLQLCRETALPFGVSTCNSAAQGGHLDCLTFLREQGAPCDASTCDSAALGGQVQVLQFLHQQGVPFGDRICEAAARGGNVHVLEYLQQQGCPLGDGICKAAAEGGNYDALLWCVEQGCELGDDICSAAVRGGNLSLLQFCWEHAAPSWDDHSGSHALSNAAAGGRVDVVRWLRERGCPFDAYTYKSAASSGHVPTLRFCFEQGPHNPFFVRTCLQIARLGRHHALLEWLKMLPPDTVTPPPPANGDGADGDGAGGVPPAGGE